MVDTFEPVKDKDATYDAASKATLDSTVGDNLTNLVVTGGRFKQMLQKRLGSLSSQGETIKIEFWAENRERMWKTYIIEDVKHQHGSTAYVKKDKYVFVCSKDRSVTDERYPDKVNIGCETSNFK